MRPKIVILTLVVAIGLIAAAALLRGIMGGGTKPQANAPDTVPVEPPATNTQVSVVNPNASNTAAITAQLRAAELAKGLDEVRELQASGGGTPATTALLLNKVTHSEPEVRMAAVEALKQLHATEAIPGLEQALEVLENPRDKVAIMDAIDYLKLPTELPPEGTPANPANDARAVGPRGDKGASDSGAQSDAKDKPRTRPASRAAPAAQPESPAPAAAPPQ
jgi:hypothetical protein